MIIADATTSTLAGLWSAGQVARFLGVSAVTLNDMAKAGKIDYFASPLGRLYEPEAVARFKEERERSRQERQLRRSA